MHVDVANDIMWLKVWLRLNVTKETFLLVCACCSAVHWYTEHCILQICIDEHRTVVVVLLPSNIFVETNFFFFLFIFSRFLCTVYTVHTFQIDGGWYLCEHSTQKDINEHMYIVRLFPFFHIHLTLSVHNCCRGCFESIYFRCL